jgi:xanthine dehydrogenase iron-sulfur cluster and FAD-binding subunit A
MYATSYHRASSADEAVKMMQESDNAKFVSGGQTLIPTMKQRLAAPDDLIDLRHIDAMKGITVNGTEVTIGAATCRRSALQFAVWHLISATRRFGTWERWAARSPTTIRLPIIPRQCSRLTRRS